MQSNPTNPTISREVILGSHAFNIPSHSGQRSAQRPDWDGNPPQLAEEIANAGRAHDAVLDGEICCLEPDGRSHFNKLLFRREWPHFYGFDVLSLNGKDLRAVPLLERKRRLLAIAPKIETRLLYLDHIAQRGRDLYRVAGDRDLEGIVGKWAHGTYQTDGRRTSWIKIKHADYSQIRDRHELFESRESRRHRTLASRGRPELHME